MRTENGIDVDAQALGTVLRQADVLIIGFPLFPERIVVDTRHNANEDQLATVVEPVANVQERYLWLGRHRGMFGAPEAFSFFIWPQTIGNLRERNLLAPLYERLTPAGARQLDEALETALLLEREAMVRTIRGEGGFGTLWDRHGAGQQERGQL